MQLKLSCEAETYDHILLHKDVFVWLVEKVTQSVGS